MNGPYRDPVELHQASPLLAVLVAAMTLATAPLTQATAPANGAGESNRPAPAATKKVTESAAGHFEIDSPSDRNQVARLAADLLIRELGSEDLHRSSISR
jgi:hypothetical protein